MPMTRLAIATTEPDACSFTVAPEEDKFAGWPFPTAPVGDSKTYGQFTATARGPYVARHDEAIAAAYGFQNFENQVTPPRRG